MCYDWTKPNQALETSFLVIFPTGYQRFLQLLYVFVSSVLQVREYMNGTVVQDQINIYHSVSSVGIDSINPQITTPSSEVKDALPSISESGVHLHTLFHVVHY
jgi:hypothetical protein